MAEERETTTQERAKRFMMDPDKELSPPNRRPTETGDVFLYTESSWTLPVSC